MTDTIAKLRKLAEAATPGPWVTQANPAQRSWKRGWWVQCDSDDPHDDPCELCGEADAALIAAMRNALPLLLDLVERADRMRTGLAIHGLMLAAVPDYDVTRSALEALNPESGAKGEGGGEG